MQTKIPSARNFVVAAVMACAIDCCCSRAFAAPPNIVFILADDLGWHDLGCYGSPWHDTPRLDRLAAEGMQFTQAYAAAPICSASRAAILTGRTPARLHFEFVTKDEPGRQAGMHPLQSPPFTLDLPLEETTIAEALAPAKVECGFFGKWHLNRHVGHYLGWSDTHGPLQQGFAVGDAEFGSHPYDYLKRDGDGWGDLKPGEHPSDALADRAIEFLRSHRKRPFLLYLSEYYVHDPAHTRAKWLFDRYRQRLPADAGDNRAAYGAMVETLDHLAGRVLDALDDLGLADKTLVVFTSDNGGHPEQSANGPLRGSKWNLYEGGIRVPLIVRWPGHVAAASTCDEPVTGCDFLPTFCAVAAVAPPKDVPLDGRSLLPLLTGKSNGGPPRPLVWHFPYYHPEKGFEKTLPVIGTDDFAISQTRPQSAIRFGDDKLVHFYEGDRDELYRLVDDPGEQHDLSGFEVGTTSVLRKRLDEYLDSVQARRPTAAR